MIHKAHSQYMNTVGEAASSVTTYTHIHLYTILMCDISIV